MTYDNIYDLFNSSFCLYMFFCITAFSLFTSLEAFAEKGWDKTAPSSTMSILSIHRALLITCDAKF